MVYNWNSDAGGSSLAENSYSYWKFSNAAIAIISSSAATLQWIVRSSMAYSYVVLSLLYLGSYLVVIYCMSTANTACEFYGNRLTLNI